MKAVCQPASDGLFLFFRPFFRPKIQNQNATSFSASSGSLSSEGQIQNVFVFTKTEIQTKSRHFNKRRKHENRLKSKGLQTGCKYAILARKGLTFCQ